MKFEKKLKKQLNLEIGDNKNPSENLYERMSRKMSFNQKSKKMRNKWVPLMTALTAFVAILVIGIVITSNSKIGNGSYNAVVQMDVNPSIQLVVDEKNKVLSVNGVNDEGKMIVHGEAIVGKTLDEAIELIVSLEVDLGYIDQGDENKVNFTISAKSDDIINKIANKTKDITTKTLDKLGVTAAIETVKGYAKDELGKLAKELDPTLTDEEIANFNYNQLVNVVRLYHLEVAEFASVKLEKYYQEYRNYEINLSEKEYIQDAIKGLDQIYQALYASYQTICDNLNNTFKDIQTAYYDAFINPESDYQKAWAELANLKEAYLIQKNVVASLPDDASLETITSESAKLVAAKSKYEIAEQTLISIEKTSETTYQIVCNTFEEILKSLNTIEETLPKEIKSITLKSVQNTENKLNEYKNTLCEKFETAHADEIARIKEEMANRKESLKSSLHTEA